MNRLKKDLRMSGAKRKRIFRKPRLPNIASDRSMRKRFCLGVNRTFDRNHSPKGTIA